MPNSALERTVEHCGRTGPRTNCKRAYGAEKQRRAPAQLGRSASHRATPIWRAHV